MTAFCKARLDADPRLAPVHGILRGAAIERTADAELLARQIVEQGRQEAQQLLAAAGDEARQAVHEAQAQVLEQAMRLQQGMDAAMAGFLEQAQEMVAELAPCTTSWCWRRLRGTRWPPAAAACCVNPLQNW
jgi:vacuolar-type H+-ATPase subunit H